MTTTAPERNQTRLPSHGFRSLDVPGRRIMSQPHRHSDVELNFVKSGALTYLLGGETVIFRADHLYVFWAAMPHQIIHATDDAAHQVLTIPLPEVLHMDLPVTFVRNLLNGTAVADTNPEHALLNRCQSRMWHGHLARGTTECRRIVRLEVEACLRRLAMTRSPTAMRVNADGAVTASLAHVNSMVAHITANYREPLSVADIAAAAGLHPSYAMQLFRKHVNMTLVEYLTQYRIAHTQRLLLTSDETVINIALACGFNSQSRFYAAFKAHCGQSPALYRADARAQRKVAEQQLVNLLLTLKQGTPDSD